LIVIRIVGLHQRLRRTPCPTKLAVPRGSRDLVEALRAGLRELGYVEDRNIVLEPVHEVWENVEHLAVGHVAEAYRRHPIPCWGGTFLLAGGVLFAIRRIIAIREPLRPPPG
jgi:hypothetical protein